MAGGLARLAAAQVLVLAHDDLVERRRGDRPVLPLVLVAAVARDPDHPDRAADARRLAGRADAPRLRLRVEHHPFDEVGQLAHAVHVVAVVDDEPDPADVEQVEPAGRLEERRREGPQPLPDVVQVRTRGPRRGGGGQRVRHVHPRLPAERGRDQVRVQDRHRPRPVAEHDQLALR